MIKLETNNIRTDGIKKIEFKTKGKLQIDNLFAKFLLDKYKTINATKASDVRGIIEEYKTFLLNYYETSIRVTEPLNILGLELVSGFNLLYGPPDYYKTTIGIHIANLATQMGLKVAYVDAENKLLDTSLDESVYYISGSNKTHDVLKYLIISDTIDLYIIDTIFTLSSSQLLLKSAVKHIAPYGNYMLLINQTRNFRYGDYSPGPDIIEELATTKYRLIRRRHLNNKIYLRTDTGIHIVFNQDEHKLVYDYNIGESVLGTALSTGVVRKLLREYSYNGNTYSKTEVIKELIHDNSRNRGCSRELHSEELSESEIN